MLKVIAASGAFRRAFKPNPSGTFIECRMICGNPLLLERIGVAMGDMISDATRCADGLNLPDPNVIMATGIKGTTLAQWTIRSLTLAGFADIEFKWCEYCHRGFRAIPGHHFGIPIRNDLIVMMTPGAGTKIVRALETLERDGGHPIGVATVFNPLGLTAEKLGVPRLLSLFSAEEILEASRNLPICQ